MDSLTLSLLTSSSSSSSSSLPSPKRRRLPPTTKAQQHPLPEEIRVCTNRTCRRQGSFQTLHTLSSLSPPNLQVNPCACLGRCGAGPNLLLLPDAVFVGHCATPARAAELMASLFPGEFDAQSGLDALALRKRAEVEFDEGNFTQAELLLSQVIDLNPFGGLHITFKFRSSVRLELGNYSGALQDANEALKLAPRYYEAYICQGDAFLALNQFHSAEQSYLAALDIDPSIRRSKSFKARIAKLQEKLADANTT
ncbi:hypothetical protein RIF29_35251 [Crotalaria pallida]|uniref:Uncharacterized protein n=1 Tax=Crotalaria pallida TaxID=3830 RepID=A0AAN9HTQ4_CROPI